MLHKHTVSAETLRLLHKICSLPSLNQFALSGGTALSLQIGHRISIDLDFFSLSAFENNTLLMQLQSYSPTIVSKETNSLSIIIDDVKVDFLRHNYPLLKPILLTESIRLFDIYDIAAMKMNAIINRGAKKDFYDLDILLDRFTKDDLFNMYQKKYGQATDLMFTKSMIFFEDAENDPDPKSLISANWEQVKEKIKSVFIER